MKRVITSLVSLCLAACLAFPAGALDYTIAAPGDPEYGDPTSIEPVIMADGGAAKNEDRSKNAARIPPAFGSPSAYALNTGIPHPQPGTGRTGSHRGGHQRRFCRGGDTGDLRLQQRVHGIFVHRLHGSDK